MKIAILGSGAMGSVYGGYLSQHNDVFLVDVWQEHIDTIREHGLEIQEADGYRVFHPFAVTDPAEVGYADLVVVFVKSTQTYDALVQARCLIDDHTLVLSLQNGYGNHEQIARVVREEQIVIGTTAHGATLLGPGKIRHAGWGFTQVGSIVENGGQAEVVAQLLQEAGFETTVADNVLALVWHKLFINVAANAVTALLGQTNGVICNCPPAHDAAALLLREAVAIANASGFNFDAEAELQSMYEASRKTQNNRSSMLQDVERRRKTEISTINGAVVMAAKKLGMRAPYNELICKLIEGVQYQYGVQ